MILEAFFRNDGTAKFTVQSPSGRRTTFEGEATILQFGAWCNGVNIQQAFPTLSADHRELLMTGIGPEEWAQIFPDDEEDERDFRERCDNGDPTAIAQSEN